MFKTIFTLICLGVSCVCFGDGFNEEALENPPKNIEVSETKNDEQFYYSKKLFTNATALDYNVQYLLGTRLLRKTSGIVPQLVYFNSKGYPTKFSIVFSNDKEISFPISRKNTFESEGKTFYRTISDLTLEQYIKFFVKETPIKFKVIIPTIKDKTLVFPIGEEWTQSFEDMKVFFRIDPEK